MITESSSVVRLLPTVSREWLYTILSLVLGIIACAWYRVADQYDKSIEADRVVPTKRLWTRYVMRLMITGQKPVIRDP